MDCKEFERLIPGFIKGQLDYRTLRKFIEHMNSCAECKEELVIQFLVIEGMVHLEEGNAFDLQRELDIRLNEARRRIRIHDSFIYAGQMLETFAVIMLIATVVWIIF